ncbi:MAG TPA: flagellar motor switch protein FliN [Candidatus Acidoferrum sp.]|nr:flagellar motor switch protein FliN [Candidatus Acidoferrum sp.]
MSETQELQPPVRTLLDQWTTALIQVLESMTDQKAEVKWQAGITLAADPEALWWEQPFQISPDAIVWVAAPRPTWEHAGTVTLQAAGLETVELSEARSTWLEILGQSLGVMARSIGALMGREVTCSPGSERAPENSPENGAAISIRFPDKALPPLWLGFSPTLVSLVCNPPAAVAHDRDEEPERQEIPTTSAPPRRTSAPATMDLILDVELPVSISFGKTELPMKDVLKLTTGSIVELNRGVNDPVEVMVNHCLIARGEVVVVEGNYGVRIQYIASRMDRMRSVR